MPLPQAPKFSALVALVFNGERLAHPKGWRAFALFATLFLPSTPPGWTSLVAVSLFLGGAQLISIGILGEYICRTYTQSEREL